MPFIFHRTRSVWATILSTIRILTMPFELFDHKRELRITTGNLPHWFQPGVTYFITFRTEDSIPVEVAELWNYRRDDWLWKKFTAAKINGTLGCRGRFWQEESFDHLVRSPDEFEHLRRYIAENPLKANLRKSEYFYYHRLAD